ncbi:MAG: 1,4-dihydroxy-2-naphthoate octaprenyltransferase [Bacteroidales bacterium]|nr:1,4-dihydroxy-2-naphthoate octaprenyltransferase [Bacteroidales bacterium]
MDAGACLRSLRLRTLPLSLAGIVLGVLLAAAEHDFSFVTVLLLALTTVCLQILSNLSNELGDTLHGTDRSDRQGIHYSLQDGVMTVRDMKRLITCFAVLSCLLGLGMVWSAFGTLLAPLPAAFLVLGAAAVWAAMHYTLGKNPYGYRGLGDLFVFIFFGLATVCGGYFLTCLEWAWPVLLPAASIGCFSVAVLNVNNIRDMKSDAATRVTVALRMGEKRARIYQTVLVVSGWVLMTVFMLTAPACGWKFIYLLTLPGYARHLKGVWTLKDRALDPMLPLLVKSTFLLALLSGIGYMTAVL